LRGGVSGAAMVGGPRCRAWAAHDPIPTPRGAPDSIRGHPPARAALATSRAVHRKARRRGEGARASHDRDGGMSVGRGRFAMVGDAAPNRPAAGLEPASPISQDRSLKSLTGVSDTMNCTVPFPPGTGDRPGDGSGKRWWDDRFRPIRAHPPRDGVAEPGVSRRQPSRRSHQTECARGLGIALMRNHGH
jgi:hypothetical protein